jgi:hypothetical protein
MNAAATGGQTGKRVDRGFGWPFSACRSAQNFRPIELIKHAGHIIVSLSDSFQQCGGFRFAIVVGHGPQLLCSNSITFGRFPLVRRHRAPPWECPKPKKINASIEA